MYWSSLSKIHLKEKYSNNKYEFISLEFGERKRKRAFGAALVRESLRERERHASAVVETAAARAQLLQLHGQRAGGQRRHEPQRRPDRHEQHGALAGAFTRLLFLRMTRAARHGATASRAHVAYLITARLRFFNLFLYISVI